MRTSKKLILSIAMMCLVAAVIVVGVLSATSVTFTIYNRAIFTATNATCQITVSGTNAGNAIDIQGNVVNINPTISSSPSLTIPDQVFAGSGSENAIVYTIAVNNQGTNNIRVSLAETYSNGDVSVTYSYTIDGQTTSDQSRGVVYSNETYTITATYILNNESTNVDFSSQLAVTIEETSDVRPAPAISGTYISITSRRENFYVGEIFDICDSTIVYIVSMADGGQYNGMCSATISGEAGVQFTTSGQKTITITYLNGEDTETLTYTVNVTTLPITQLTLEGVSQNVNSADYFIEYAEIVESSYDGSITINVPFDSSLYEVYAYIELPRIGGYKQEYDCQLTNGNDLVLDIPYRALTGRELFVYLFAYNIGQVDEWATDETVYFVDSGSSQAIQRVIINAKPKNLITSITSLFYDFSQQTEVSNRTLYDGTDYIYYVGNGRDYYGVDLSNGDLYGGYAQVFGQDGIYESVVFNVEDGYTAEVKLGNITYTGNEVLSIGENTFFVDVYDNNHNLAQLSQIVIESGNPMSYNSADGIVFDDTNFGFTEYRDDTMPTEETALISVDYESRDQFNNNLATASSNPVYTAPNGITYQIYDETNTSTTTFNLNEFHNRYVIRYTMPSGKLLYQSLDVYCDQYHSMYQPVEMGGSFGTVEFGGVYINDKDYDTQCYLHDTSTIITWTGRGVPDLTAIQNYIEFNDNYNSSIMTPSITQENGKLYFNMHVAEGGFTPPEGETLPAGTLIRKIEMLVANEGIVDNNTTALLAHDGVIFGEDQPFVYDNVNNKYVLSNGPYLYYKGIPLLLETVNPKATITYSSNIDYVMEMYLLNAYGMQTVTFTVTSSDGTAQATYEIQIDSREDIPTAFTLNVGNVSKTLYIDTLKMDTGDFQQDYGIINCKYSTCQLSDVSSVIDQVNNTLTGSFTITNQFQFLEIYANDSLITDDSPVTFDIYTEKGYKYIKFDAMVFVDEGYEFRLYLLEDSLPINVAEITLGSKTFSIEFDNSYRHYNRDSFNSVVNLTQVGSGYNGGIDGDSRTFDYHSDQVGNILASDVTITTDNNNRYVSATINFDMGVHCYDSLTETEIVSGVATNLMVVEDSVDMDGMKTGNDMIVLSCTIDGAEYNQTNSSSAFNNGNKIESCTFNIIIFITTD